MSESDQVTNQPMMVARGRVTRLVLHFFLQNPSEEGYTVSLIARALRTDYHAVRSALRRLSKVAVVAHLGKRYVMFLKRRGAARRLYDAEGKAVSVEDAEESGHMSESVLDTLPSTPPTAPNPEQDSFLIEPRFLTLAQFLDLKAARWENVKCNFRTDLHIGRLLHDACEKGPGRRDRSKKKSHSEESFTLLVTKDAWVRLIPKRADFPAKLVQWLQSAKMDPPDVLQVATDLMNQSADARAILEIPAKWRLPDGEQFLLRMKHEGKLWEIQYVRSHGGEYEVRSENMRSQMDFLTLFAGTVAAVWPEFSELRDSIREQLQSTREDLEKTTIEKVRTLEEDVKKLRGIIERLLEQAIHGPSPEAKKQDEKSTDYIF